MKIAMYLLIAYSGGIVVCYNVAMFLVLRTFRMAFAGERVVLRARTQEKADNLREDVKRATKIANRLPAYAVNNTLIKSLNEHTRPHLLKQSFLWPRFWFNSTIRAKYFAVLEEKQ